MVVVELACRHQRDGDGVAQTNRAREVQRLVDVEHAMANRFAKHTVFCVFRVYMGRIDVARHNGKQLDIRRLHRA